MSTPVTTVVCVLAAVYGLLGVLLVRRERHRPLERDRIVAEARAQHDVGPDPLRLLEDLEAHLKAYGEAVADYYDTTTGDR